MAILPHETKEVFIKILSHFASIIPVPPMIVSMDQDAACIAAAGKVFPSCNVTLDDWHLNKNHLKNIHLWCRNIKKENWMKIMSDDLHQLRRCSEKTEFLARRNVIEKKYFTDFSLQIPK